MLASTRRALGALVLPPSRRRARAVSPTSGREVSYAPRLNGAADPGEIVWTWVPFEESPREGKDRPVLVVGHKGRTLLGLMLSSNPMRDGQPNWQSLGTGNWDQARRASWVRLDRVLAVGDRRIRREAAVLDGERFERVAGELRRHYGWR